MEFKKVMEIKRRVCLNMSCSVCPLREEINNRKMLCSGFMAEHPAKVEQILIEWDKAHPVKTFLSDFLEKYPNAPLNNEDGTPKWQCPYRLGYTRQNGTTVENCIFDSNGKSDCLACWNRPLEV